MPLPLTRQELAEFLPSQRAIRAFENLFATTSTITTIISPGGETLGSNVAQQFVEDITDLITAIAAPSRPEPPQSEEGEELTLEPRQEIGTIADQNADDVDITGLIGLLSYTVATVPSAAIAGKLIYVSDETGGAVPAFSDGTNWRRVTDRVIVS